MPHLQLASLVEEHTNNREGKHMTIILCCGANGRAVIIGNVKSEPKTGKPVRLTDARMVLYWARECGGLLGLAANGPKGDTRITATVPVLVETVWQEWCAVTDVAAAAIAEWPADAE